MTEEKDRRIRYALLWSFRLLKKYRLGFEIAMLSGIILSAINLATVIYIEQAVEQITHKKNNIIMIGTILLCLFVAGTVLTYMTEYISGKIGSCVARDVRDTFTDKIMRINQKSKDQLNSGDMISRFNYDLGIITDFIPGGITNFVYQMVMAVTAIVYMLYINWLLLVISIAIVPVCMIIVNILRKRISDSFKENMKNIGQANKVAFEAINNINVIKAYNLQDIIFNNIKMFYKGSLNSWIKIHKLFSPMLMLNILMNEFPKVFCITMGSYLALNHYLVIGKLVGFVLLLDYVVNPITRLPDFITSISNTGAACERIAQTYELQEERQDGIDLSDNIKNQVLLEMKNVKFGYNESKIVLDNINLKLKSGEKVALVGKSGCGKSSVIKLLSGFYDYNKGEMDICGRPYHEISLKSIRKHIALVSQEVTIFPWSVADNIGFGSNKKDLTREEIIEAAKYANAHEFIMNMLKGYDTVLEENGKNLSGGQKQMISIARAFLKNAPIVLLDESTSALDAQSEAVVTESLDRLIQDKGVIIVSHRFSSIIKADRILVLNNGKVVEEGTHEALIEWNSLYKKLYLSGFKDKEELRL
jgi:ABC-type multidrug transport system fused ATPase/permease subunit